ncbi:lysophospholipid acyltransferase family protein [Brumicola blandensis]|uniref:L-ornithine N(alpha)-acyltransferase n=1 Tax=Brumicola blandensis TaxID=3075611 RepID=A0AAW8R3V9_9ALTE|nr:lysophospholipid acyltransferase family protein [Alteromonas sp. W409]MDT0583962.1 lysophospholipid acyltransferase family protein [Alteromonas sp. W409]
MFSVEHLIEEHYPGLRKHTAVYKPLSSFLRYLLHENDAQAFARQYGHLQGIDFVEQILDYFTFRFSVSDIEKERIPSEGKLVIVANHPIGSLDALALIKLISDVRKDLKVVANEMLMALNPLHSILLPVNNMQGNTAKQNLRLINKHLDSDGAVLIFPAGEVSRLRPQGVRDSKWKKGFLRMAKQTRSPILPVFINAKNSPLFYGVSMLFKPAATSLLVREMFKKKHQHIKLHVGELIPVEAYLHSNIQAKEQVNLFRKHVYRLGTQKPSLFKTQSALALPEDRRHLRKAILNDCESLGETPDNKKILLYRHTGSNPIMREIGRLREIAFRAVGEGSNSRRDIDAFDYHYLHLILWDDNDLEIAGAYRLGDASVLTQEKHPTGLYSASLFDYQAPMQTIFKEGLELGRSFVQPKYWGKRSLDYLWLGIGAFMTKYPKYRYCFGPVSISNALPASALALLVQFYSKYFPSNENFANAKLPFIPSTDSLYDFHGNDYMEEFKVLKSVLANMNTTIPTLLKQYADICEDKGVCFAAFNVDPDFNYCVDGLIIMDSTRLTKSKRKRYMPSKFEGDMQIQE